MPMLILDPTFEKEVREKLDATGAERFDEVWDGVYVVAPMPNVDHQRLARRLASALDTAIGSRPEDDVFAGVNVSDREVGWVHNYRCPDVAVYLSSNPAKELETHWHGGPDFLVEILSAGDRGHDKFAFYASIGTREVLIIDRDPWQLELYRLQGGHLVEVGRADVSSGASVASAVLPVSFSLAPRTERPAIVVTHSDGRVWLA